ncbi:hypothetical protein BDV18DRAFT_27286 [Aspergillus unguis]
MPIKNYGVWKGRAVDYNIEEQPNSTKPPQFDLFFYDNDKDFVALNPRQNGYTRRPRPPGALRAAINITSGDLHDSRLVYWVNHQIDKNPITDELTQLERGFLALDKGNTQCLHGLDYIRHSLFTTSCGRLLPHDIPGQFNDIIDILVPNVQRAVAEKADVYIFGSRSGATEIHNVHMNQGNGRKFRADDGVFQDGGLLIHFRDWDEWIGVFLAFSSQAVHTDSLSGHSISGVDWRDLLRPDIIEDGVVIQEAYVHPPLSEKEPAPVRRRKSVTLSNRTNRLVRLGRWSIRNGAGEVQTLPGDAALIPRIDRRFDLTSCALSDQGDTILLLNADGMKVDGVSYNSQQGNRGGPIMFAH